MTVAGAANGKMLLGACLTEGRQPAALAATDAGFAAPPSPPPRSTMKPAPSRRCGTSAAGTERGKAFVDFQNDVTADDIALAAREGFRSVEHLKRYTTLGMATDQGKTPMSTALPSWRR